MTVSLIRRAIKEIKYNTTSNPLVECVFAFVGGVKPFARAVFELFVLGEWKLEIVLSYRQTELFSPHGGESERGLSRRVDTCHTAPGTASQG